MAEQELSQAAAQGAPSPDSGATPGEAGSGAPSGNAGQVTELADLNRYSYQGRPLKDWTSGYMRQQDYTSKTQEIAQERKYYDNLNVDLARVRSNPQLADQFMKIYPEKFHGYLQLIQQESRQQPQGQPAQQQQSRYAQLDPGFLAEFNHLKETNRQREVAAITAEIDNVFGKMSQKYPFADEEAVVARGQALLEMMKKQDPSNPNLRITEKQWEQLWKGQHERSRGLSDAQYKKQVQAQIAASGKGGDVGSGGGVPGQAPRQYRTIKEATAAALADIESGAV